MLVALVFMLVAVLRDPLICMYHASGRRPTPRIAFKDSRGIGDSALHSILPYLFVNVKSSYFYAIYWKRETLTTAVCLSVV
jgi:hypothetical protein